MQQTQTYRERSRAFLTKAREEFAAGDLVQASEKAWGAAAMMVKAAAEQRGIPHESHQSLWHIVDDLDGETGDIEIARLFHVASGLHKNFYENRMRARTVRRGIQDVERFVDKVERVV